MGEAPTSLKVMLSSLMIVFGSLYTLSYKFQNSQRLQGHDFYHPYMQVISALFRQIFPETGDCRVTQTTVMFACQSLALVVYFSMKRVDLSGYEARYRLGEQEGKDVQFSKLVMLVPAAADLSVSCLRYVALNFVPGSVFQMMRGGCLVTTFLFSWWLLGMRAQRHQLFGFGLAVVGLALVGVAQLQFPAQQQDSEVGSGTQVGFVELRQCGTQGDELVGYFLLVASLIIQGFYYTYQEKLFRKYHIEPLQMVGYEGVFGFVLSLLLVVGLNFVPCETPADTLCILSERPARYFQQIGSNFVLLVFVLLGVLAVSGFNIVGVTITKHLSGLARTICHLSSTIIVWVVGLILTVSSESDHPSDSSANYKWQTTRGLGIAVQVVGLILLLAGNLFYNRIVSWARLEPASAESTIIDQSLDSYQSQQRRSVNGDDQQ